MSIARRKEKDSAGEEREFTFSPADLDFIIDAVYQHAGIVLNDSKKEMIYGRIVRRVRALGLESITDYCEFLRTTEAKYGELEEFVNVLTTNLTHFFREPHHFEHLQHKVLEPVFADKSGSHRIRLWSAGCSTGMEPYSMAMTVAPLLAKNPGYDLKILATDVNTEVLDKAKEGVYSAKVLKPVPSAYRKSGILPVPKTHKLQGSEKYHLIAPELRKLISFKYMNFLETWPVSGPFDAIFCRNVLIYFDDKTSARIFDGFANVLKIGGFLYIGHSENLRDMSNRLELVDRTTYQRVR